LANESDHLAAQLHQEQIEEDLKIVDVAGITDGVAGKLIEGGYFLAERLLDDATETIMEKTGLSAAEIADVRRRVAAYFQDIKISDVADLPKAYKDALITGGFHTVEEYLGARLEEIAERSGLDPQDLEEVTRILSSYDTQVEEEE
jgi:hypothetical protein